MTEPIAIEWLKTLNSWSTLRDEPREACKLAIKALEKQIPKKPKITRTSACITFGICPNCGTEIDNLDNRFYHKTAACLQQLDWSEE